MRNTGSSSTYGFMGCTNLVKAALPQGLVTISRNLFTDTKIDSLTIPESVTSIGEYNQEIKGETNVVAIPVNG